jgi:tripartite-type tricarboxylate transporter receptor subunit TctC
MNLLRLAFGVIALALATCGVASAQYPTRPVRLVVGFAAGGPTDILARRMAQYLSEKLGQQFIVENKPGATGNVATEYVLNAQPDGYTILVTTTANAINMTFYSKLSFDFLRDATPVAGLASISYMMLLNPGVPAKPSRSSSPTPRPIPARSISRPAASAPRTSSPASCSR